MTPAASEAEAGGAAAMADLILGTTGILLVLLVTLGPAVLSRQASATAREPLALPPGFSTEGHAGPILFAGAGGLALAPGGTVIPVSAIATSPLPAGPGTARPLLIVAPDGIEAAFHASARLAALGATAIDRVRVDRTCAEIRRIERRGTGLVLVCGGR
ncbi:hypothetical protein [Aquibium microcysteis]|uniref:hypothetical protein n=1 Tax=Aquibium microcysteis TaxID=675281 RepID=UPI00165D0174|nr:hypothetical protein [Aquibium microcysteis]